MDQLQIHYVDLGVPRITDMKSELSIGRTEGNDLVLNHPSVSRKHARVEARNSAWWIVDIKSMPSVDFSGESMFDNPSGTVIRRISDFNSEFGLDLGEIQEAAGLRV